MMPRSIVLVCAAALAACSPPNAADKAPVSEATAALHPVSGLRVIPLTVDSGNRTHDFRVELADTQEAQTRGLMFRTELADDEGMIFPSAAPQTRSFWMRNTPIPLDIIFIAPDRTILNIARETTPYSLESVPSAGPVIAVLELRGGLAEELGIKPGDKVQW